MDPLEWIKTKCRASQNHEELFALYNELVKLPPWTILEIGVHKGYSLEAWADLFPRAEEIIGIELHTEDLDQSVLQGRGQITVIGADSHEPNSKFTVEHILKGRKLDFLFIDGDHTLESVKKDFDMYSPLVRSGGIVALHDASLRDNPLVEVYKFWEEIMYKYDCKIITGGEEQHTGFDGKGTGTGIIYI